MRPFEWGLEHVGLSGHGADGGMGWRFLGSWAEHTVAHSDSWFDTEPAVGLRLASFLFPRKARGRRMADMATAS